MSRKQNLCSTYPQIITNKMYQTLMPYQLVTNLSRVTINVHAKFTLIEMIASRNQPTKVIQNISIKCKSFWITETILAASKTCIFHVHIIFIYPMQDRRKPFQNKSHHHLQGETKRDKKRGRERFILYKHINKQFIKDNDLRKKVTLEFRVICINVLSDLNCWISKGRFLG